MKKDIHYYLSKPLYRALLLFPPIIINFIILYTVLLNNNETESYSTYNFSIYILNMMWILISVGIINWSDNKE